MPEPKPINTEWRPYEGGTVGEHCLDVELLPIPREEHGAPSYRADVRLDGCIHLRCYYNGHDPAQDPEGELEDNSDYIHICDIDEYIEELQALKRAAVAHFGEDWPR